MNMVTLFDVIQLKKDKTSVFFALKQQTQTVASSLLVEI